MTPPATSQPLPCAEPRGGDHLERLHVEDPRWTGFVSRSDEALAFHQPAWAKTLAAAYGFEPFGLALTSSDGSIVAGIPLVEIERHHVTRWLSLPFSDICPPLGEPSAVPKLVAAIRSEVSERRIAGAEIRSRVDCGAQTSWRGVTHELQLCTDTEAVRSQFSRSQVQRSIVRSKREGVVVRRGERREDLLEVFFSLHLLTRRRQGLPAQPPGFFRHLWEQMIAPGHGFILISYIDEVPAAAAVFLLGSTTVTYKYGASDAAYWSRRPNHPLFWEAIRWSCEHDYRVFDFGRTDCHNEGLRSFKRGWGADERELRYSAFGKPPFRPPVLTKSILGPVIRHSPMPLHRALGWLLYRFIS